jgi:hypothetical protein
MCVVSSLVLDAEREKMAQNKSYDLKKSSRWRCRNFRQFTPVAFYFAALSAYRSVLLFGYGKYSYFSESMETFFGRSEWWGEWG